MKNKRELLSKSFLIFLSTILALVIGSLLSGLVIANLLRLFSGHIGLSLQRDQTLTSWLTILSEFFAIIAIVLFNHFFFKIKVHFFNRDFMLGLKTALPSLFFVFINLMVFLSRKQGLTLFELFTAVAVSLSVGFFEEYASRGLILGNLLGPGKQAYSYLTATILSAVFFALLHLINLFSASFAVTAVQVIYVFALGLVFAAAYVWSKNLSVTILIHALIDGLAFASDPQAILGLGHPKVTWLQFVFQGIILLIFLFYTIRLFKKADVSRLAKKWS